MKEQKIPDCREYVRPNYGIRHENDETERNIFSIIACGDTEAFKEAFENYKLNRSHSEKTGKLSDNPLRNTKYHMVLFAADTIHSCVDAGMEQKQASSLAQMYIRLADKSVDIEKTEELCHDMAWDFCRRMGEIAANYRVSFAVRRAEEYICANMHKRISAAEIADYAGYNRSYLSLLFKRETGLTMQDYVTRKRIDTAKNMLRTTDYSFAQIAESLSFSTQSYFCRQFKNVTGMTPKEYRQRKDTD